jgi:cleavage and polyadenylation specificity factor subunit 1
MATADAEGNVLTFRFNPGRHDSETLECCGDVHVGTCISRMLRCTMFEEGEAGPPPTTLTTKQRTALVYGTHSGSLGAIVPLDELSYKRLELLQIVMTNVLCQRAGLNPRSFRLRRWRGGDRSPYRLNSRASRQRSVADGALLAEYLALDRSKQKELARAIGTSVHVIIETILKIQHSISFF